MHEGDSGGDRVILTLTFGFDSDFDSENRSAFRTRDKTSIEYKYNC